MALVRSIAVLCVALSVFGCRGKAPASPSPLPQSNFLTFISQPGDGIGGGRTYRFTPETATFRQQQPPFGASIRIMVQSNDLQSWWYVDLGAPFGQPLQTGSYERAKGLGIPDASRPLFSLVGEGRGCDSEGAFTIRDLSFRGAAPDSSSFQPLNRLHVVFEQRCTATSAPGLTGELLFLAAP
jgi:hypothetical protein